MGDKIGRIGREARRAVIGTVGFTLLIIGIIAIPYPGPGWLIVFTALAILSTEFAWAQRLLVFAKSKYDRWESWVRQQGRLVQIIFFVLTCLVVVLTIWLLNGYGFINQWLGLGHDWVNSPIPLFRL